MLLDSYAWIEFFRGSDEGKKVQRVLKDATVVYTAPVVLAEVYSRLYRKVGIDAANQCHKVIQDQCALIVTDEDIALHAGEIHATFKKKMPDFGMADAFVLASARDRSVKVLTGDPHFKDIEDAVML